MRVASSLQPLAHLRLGRAVALPPTHTHTPSPRLRRLRRRPIVLSGARAACPLPARVIFYLF